MRNRLLTWGLLAVLAAMSLALGGCGSHAASGSKSTALFDPAVVRADTPEAIDAELAARFEKTKKAADKMFAEEEGHLVITHKYGKTILPEQPQRIAVIGLEDTAVSLDIPIAAAHLTKSSYLYPLMKDKGIANIPINAETKTINLEAVQQAKPDLILMRDSYDKNAYNALSKIAPVVALACRKRRSRRSRPRGPSGKRRRARRGCTLTTVAPSRRAWPSRAISAMRRWHSCASCRRRSASIRIRPMRRTASCTSS